MRTRGKFLLITLAVLAVVAGALYAAAPALIAAIASRSLSGTFQVSELRIGSVSPSRVEVPVIRINNSQMRLEAQRGVVHYDPWPFQIREISVDRAHLVLSGAPEATAATSDAVLPAPLPFPVKIRDLRLDADTPWGPLTLPVSIDSRPGPAGGFRVQARAAELSLAVTNPGADRHRLVIHDEGVTELLSLELDAGGGWPVGFSGRIDPAAAVAWLRGTAAAPDALKSRAAAFVVDGGRLEVQGRLRQNLEFNSDLKGGLQVRDDRQPPERAFELIELRDLDYGIERSAAGWSGSGKASLRLVAAPETTFRGDDPDWRWSDDGIELGLSRVALVETGLEANTLSIAIPEPDSFDPLTGRLAAGGLRLASSWPEGLAYYGIGGNWSLSDSLLQAGGSGSGPGLPGLDWTFESGAEAGHVEITSRQAVAPLASTLRQYTRAVARELDIADGELDARYRLDWDGDQQRTDLKVTVSALQATLDEMAVRGLHAGLHNNEGGLDTLEMDVAVPELELAAGTVARDLAIKARLALPVVHIDQARAGLFDGTLSLRPAAVDLDKETIVLNADIENLSLDRVMTLFELESTELTGQVSGPVHLVYDKKQGLEINEGELQNVSPGVLRFSLSGGGEAPAQLNNIALQALENFQYDELKASVLYKPDGEYRIKARILGRNPEVLDGHPIALNPTIEGRLPALFRSFFVTGDFSRAIIERLQEEQGLSTPGEPSAFSSE